MGDKSGAVIRPSHNVNIFTAQFVYDRAHSDAALAHARTHRINPGVMGNHGYFTAATGFAGNGLYLHHPARYFRNLQFKKFGDYFGMFSGKYNGRAAMVFFHPHHINP